MLLGVPTMAVIYYMVGRFNGFLLRKRNLPVRTDDYVYIDHVDEEAMKGLPVPDVTMLVASASMEQEMEYMLKINPRMEFVIYTLDFVVAASMPKLCKEMGFSDPEIIQVSVSKVTSRHTYDNQPAPWIICCKGGE